MWLTLNERKRRRGIAVFRLVQGVANPEPTETATRDSPFWDWFRMLLFLNERKRRRGIAVFGLAQSVANPERTETATRDGRFMAWLILNRRKRRFEFQEFPGKQYSGDFPEYNIPGASWNAIFRGFTGILYSGESPEFESPFPSVQD